MQTSRLVLSGMTIYLGLASCAFGQTAAPVPTNKAPAPAAPVDGTPGTGANPLANLPGLNNIPGLNGLNLNGGNGADPTAALNGLNGLGGGFDPSQIQPFIQSLLGLIGQGGTGGIGNLGNLGGGAGGAGGIDLGALTGGANPLGNLTNLTNLAGNPAGASNTSGASLGNLSGLFGGAGGAGNFLRAFEQPVQGFPNLAVRGTGGAGLLRTTPGLDKAMACIQQGNQGTAVQALQDTMNQVNQATSGQPGLVPGKQVAATQNALQIGQSTLGSPGSGPFQDAAAGTPVAAPVPGAPAAPNQPVNPAFTNAVAAAQNQSSPILFDLNGNGKADVTTPDARDARGPFVHAGSTRFDVSGRGQGRLTEWLKPGEDGLLAFDANNNGIVDSITELFGDAEGFADGYAKLALLDLNHDGWLKGSELAGLSLWVDRNGDGVCQPGELTGVRELRITAIAVHHHDYESTYVRNGKVCKSWDWFPRTEPAVSQAVMPAGKAGL